MPLPSTKLLVTTALEQTWGDEEPIVFLGEWCRLYDRREVWTKRPHQVIRNHWDDRKKLRNDYDYLKSLHDSLLTDLVHTMNTYHQINRPRRYWRMIMGYWLMIYLAVVWDRWECLRLAFEEHQQMKTNALEPNIEYLPCYDHNDFMTKIFEDPWNHQLFLEIIKSNYLSQCNIRRLPIKLSSVGDLNPIESNKAKATGWKWRVSEFVDTLLGRLPIRNQVVIFRSYFQPAALVGLHLKLKQLPRLYWKEFDWPVPLGDSATLNGSASSRDKFSLKLKPTTSFEVFLLNQIVRDIPSVYMERFSLLRSRAKQIRMKPKVILTANAHWSNDLFKCWSAEQVLGGTKLVTMQHGGCFYPAFAAMNHEEDISDIRTVWSVPHHPKCKQLPPNKLAGKMYKVESKKYLGVIANELPRYSYKIHSGPIAAQSLTCYDMVCELHSLLIDEIKAHFVVKTKTLDARQRFVDALGVVKVSNEANFFRFLSGTRVVVCTYPQTTFSEAMASGLPSILFYPPHLWETIPEMDPLLETLRTAKIVFHDPKAAATHINSIWNDPEQWWNSPDVLHARNEFHQQALDLDSHWLKEWTTFIKGVLAS